MPPPILGGSTSSITTNHTQPQAVLSDRYRALLSDSGTRTVRFDLGRVKCRFGSEFHLLGCPTQILRMASHDSVQKDPDDPADSKGGDQREETPLQDGGQVIITEPSGKKTHHETRESERRGKR